MTFVLRRRMHRRTFLRGAGAALALPWLEAMAPPLMARQRTAAAAPRRIGFVYIPHGVIMNQWTPAAAGAAFEFTPILQPLEPYRNDLIVVSNLTRAAAVDNHACSASAWLTGVAAKRTDGPDFRNGESVDQVIARQIGQDTTFPTLELATEDFTGLVGACDPGYSCAYINTLNWQTPTTPLPMEINPRVVFDRLFGSGRTAADRAARRETDRSLLDFVAGDLRQLERGLGAADKARLGEYLGYVREIERRIQRAEERAHNTPEVPNAPVGVPESYEEHVGLMFDLLALAYQADLTRVFTFMMAREVSQRTYPEIGVTEPHHTISHHGNRPAAITSHATLNAHHVTLFARFIERLRTTREGDGTLLDHSLIVYGSGMSDGNGHTGGPLPHVLLGKAGGRVRGNRHLVTPEGTPMANMLLALAQLNGVEQDRFGVSRGTIDL
ncbi:MAG TPA: DUF1552 domain-containing protein [Vicinamibacterales bacterium]|nr:DUF1552 domain-containing protein [Vicinamibacterales bacterium]